MTLAATTAWPRLTAPARGTLQQLTVDCCWQLSGCGLTHVAPMACAYAEYMLRVGM